MQAAEYGCKFILNGFLINLAVVPFRTAAVLHLMQLPVGHALPALPSVLNKSRIAIMGNAPHPGIQRHYLIFPKTGQHMPQYLAGQILRIAAAVEPVITEMVNRVNIWYKILSVNTAS